MIPYLNISCWSTRSHPSKGEHRRNIELCFVTIHGLLRNNLLQRVWIWQQDCHAAVSQQLKSKCVLILSGNHTHVKSWENSWTIGPSVVVVPYFNTTKWSHLVPAKWDYMNRPLISENFYCGIGFVRSSSIAWHYIVLYNSRKLITIRFFHQYT